MILLEAQQITKHFGGITAVEDCSFAVRGNTITSLIGPNGAGKTTVFDMINGMVRPDKGNILLKRENITRLPIHRRSQHGIARTFQQMRLFRNLTLRDNLLLADQSASEEELLAVLKNVGVHKPLDTVANELSFGQQRLVEIARALLTDFDIILMDEPTAGVNPLIRQELKKILLDIKKAGKTVFLIEHDMDFVMEISDEVIVLNYGKVLKIGTPQQVIKDKQVLEAYLGEV